jgi:acyl carrier protein
MDTTVAKLEKCFLRVFPNLDSGMIQQASVDNVPKWDSVAQITLLTLIGEEFAIDVDFEEFEGATSFPAILDRLRHTLEGLSS